MHKPPFRADHVGSFLRPAALLDAREKHRAGAIDDDALRTVEDTAIRDVVAMQEGLGLKGITDGLVFLLPYESHHANQDVRSFDFQGQPVVAIEYRPGAYPFPTVNIDDYGGTEQAVGYLISLRHRRIGFIGGPAGRLASETRLNAYRDALTEANLTLDPDLLKHGDFTQPTGFTAAQELLRLADPPTAIFATNDLSAFGVLEAIKHYGLRLPEDISVVGFDDIPMASQVFPPLTTVKRPLEQLGATAVRLLLAKLRGETTETNVTLPTRLVVRSTTQKRG